MRRLIYSMNVSLDGYVEPAGGGPDWAVPDEELHRLFNDQLRETELSLYGRRLWEVMAPHWSVVERDPEEAEDEVEFARLWQANEKVVFSQTLEEVEGNARLVRGDPVEEIRRLKAQNGGDMEIGGPTLAAAAVRAGLVDEYRLVLHPVVLGGGLPFLPDLDTPLELELVEQRQFDSGVAYLRYLA